jgi:hypothetical protein
VILGRTTNADLARLSIAQKTIDQQKAEFKDDALKAGAKLYGMPLQPIPWDRPGAAIADALVVRSNIATSISARRDGEPVSIVTNEEMEGLRNMLHTATPQKAEALFRTLAGMPDDKKRLFAASLAGKNQSGDFLSNSYAASLSLFSSKDAQDQAAASKILKGAAIRKEHGMKAPPVDNQAWQTAIQDTFGNIYKDAGGPVPKLINDAIASVYTHDMFVAGKTGEAAPDIDVLNSAIKQVVGNTVNRAGQSFFPPYRGMLSVDKALSQLTDGDVQNLRTTEGKPVTAQQIRDFAQFTNIADGLYMVRIPDGRGGVPSEILDYSNPYGPTAFHLDMRPLVERAERFGFIEENLRQKDNTPVGVRPDTSRRFMPLPAPDAIGR